MSFSADICIPFVSPHYRNDMHPSLKPKQQNANLRLNASLSNVCFGSPSWDLPSCQSRIRKVPITQRLKGTLAVGKANSKSQWGRKRMMTSYSNQTIDHILTNENQEQGANKQKGEDKCRKRMVHRVVNQQITLLTTLTTNEWNQDTELLRRQNIALKEQNTSLKEQSTSLKEQNTSLKEQNTSLRTENRSLKAENESLVGLLELQKQFPLSTSIYESYPVAKPLGNNAQSQAIHQVPNNGVSLAASNRK